MISDSSTPSSSRCCCVSQHLPTYLYLILYIYDFLTTITYKNSYTYNAFFTIYFSIPSTQERILLKDITLGTPIKATRLGVGVIIIIKQCTHRVRVCRLK